MDRHSRHVCRLYGLRYALTVIKCFYRLQTPLPKHLDKGSPSIIDVYWSPIKGEVSRIKVGPWPPCKDYNIEFSLGWIITQSVINSARFLCRWHRAICVSMPILCVISQVIYSVFGAGLCFSCRFDFFESNN